MFVCGECGATQPQPGHCGADGAALAPIGDDLLLGTTIGPYRVARLMGIGGMGRVYKGVHPQIGSRVAIKVLSRECTDRRDLVERFFAEARAANLIRHESIVNVLDQAMLADGRPYIVMEYLDGSSLAAIIEDAQQGGLRLPLGGIARLIVEVLEALGAAHAKGIIHRDLKPDNIYVTPQGRAKVLDFGIAKLVPELGGSSTHTGSLLGTPHYMASEQAAGRPIDARADLYAIGVILFECATLQRPFTAPALFDLLRLHIEAPPPSPRALRGDMPEGMEQVIYAALAKLPEQRFGSAQAMSNALQHATAALAGDQWAPILPARSGRPSSPAAWAPTPPASWAGSGGRTDRQPKDATSPSTQTAGQLANMPAQKPASKRGLAIALLGVAVVGGGVAIAMLAGGGETKPVVTTGSGSGSNVAIAPIDAATSVTEIDATAPEVVITTRGGEMSKDEAEALDAVVGEMIDNLPPARRAKLPKELLAALKKYGGWSKIPDTERHALLGNVGSLVAALAGAEGFDIEGGDMDIFSDVLSAEPSNPKPVTVTARPADGWIEDAELTIPGAFDAKKANFLVLLGWAMKEAKRLNPKAELVRADASSIASNGTVDVSAEDIEFRFKVSGRADGKCMFKISVDEDGAEVSPMSFPCANQGAVAAPRCSLAQVWKKAGLATDKRVEVSYRAFAGKTKWYVRDGDITSYKAFDDDC